MLLLWPKGSELKEVSEEDVNLDVSEQVINNKNQITQTEQVVNNEVVKNDVIEIVEF